MRTSGRSRIQLDVRQKASLSIRPRRMICLFLPALCGIMADKKPMGEGAYEIG